MNMFTFLTFTRLLPLCEPWFGRRKKSNQIKMSFRLKLKKQKNHFLKYYSLLGTL